VLKKGKEVTSIFCELVQQLAGHCLASQHAVLHGACSRLRMFIHCFSY